MEYSMLNNNENCRSFSRLQNSVNNIVQHNSAPSVHDKLRHCRNTQTLATEDRIESSSNSESKCFDFIVTSPNISNKIPILNELGIDVVRKGTSKFSNFENSSITENIEQILQISEGDICEEQSKDVKKCNLIPDIESDGSSRIHCDETIKEIETYNMRYAEHNETPWSTKSRDPVIYENVYPLCTPVNPSFSEHEYDLLKKASSPLLSDLECRSYLKSLMNTAIPEKVSNSSKASVFEAKHRGSEQQSSFIGLKEMENKTDIDKSLHNYADSQEKELNQFWANISSQNDHFNSPEENSSKNIASAPNYDECCGEKRSFFTKNSNAVNENLSQESETEILNHILSQNFTESDTLLGEVLKNMNNLSQKSVKQRNSLHNFNQNSNKLLELALMMYKQFKTNVILSNKEKVISTQSIRSQIEVERNGSTRIYRLKENPNDELIILDINSNSYNSECESYNYSNIASNETDKKILQGLYEIYQNKTFLYKKEDDGLHFSRRNKISVINKIEEIFEDVLEKLAANKSPELKIRRQTFEDCLIDKKMLMLKFIDNPRIIKIHYKNVLSQPKFCLIMYVLAKSLELLKNNTKLTKREIYYQIKSLVSDQGKINSAIKAVSCMLLVGPWDLNIIAHKGMVFGDLKIKLCSNEIINCNVPGTLIPNDIDDFVELISSAYFILVVEKESIYYKLLEEDLPNRLVKSFIMITGKGFPDLNTQIFLRKLWMVMSLPIFILTDADPHGVNIMITYRFGSLANAHISDQLSVPKAKWLGIFPSEITKFDAEKQPLTDYEKCVIKNILKTPYMTDNPRIEAELKIMLELGYKAGIEGIIKNDTFLSEFYFPMKFYNQDLI
ncbi:hypothetical protein WA026_017044 [Henosepilachna vigintioctopunctata]|uniref:DNA topoisomerase (ATP-hydrolyzing) n=1 Tax=Henosepilachna vigintioctopunctata TaxID=420089 RepID=A0AAW1TPL6_9CUCU